MKSKNNELSYLTWMVFLFILGISLGGMVVYFFAINWEAGSNTELHLIQHLGTTYYSDDNIFIRFNATDPMQLSLVKKIEEVCRINKIPNCMNGNQRFYP